MSAPYPAIYGVQGCKGQNTVYEVDIICDLKRKCSVLWNLITVSSQHIFSKSTKNHEMTKKLRFC